MKKPLLILVFTIIAGKVFAQADDGMVTEEKSSDWVKVTTAAVVSTPPRSNANSNTSNTTATTRPAARTTTSKPATTQPKTAQPKPAESFDKTNQKVKRFKKGS